jgi:poly-gamma-glutamate synthesis protein (capsule biosynthesis protein)
MIEQICKTAITVFCSVLFINLLSCSNDVIIDDADKNIINASTAVCVTDLNTDENINGSGESKKITEPVTQKISFLAAGDNIVYLGNVSEAEKYSEAGGRVYNFKNQYKEVMSLISGTDIAFINQETLMTGDGYKFSYYPRFNGPCDMGYDLIDSGFDIINIANNHMLDMGADGLKKTIEFWRNETSAFIIGDYLGSGEFGSIRIYEKQGIKIAFLSYTYSTNGLSSISADIAIPYLNEETAVRQISAAHAAADLVFVSVHWGDENSFVPNSNQIYYAQLMCDLGADVIIGHHPHVIQPIVWLEGTDGHKMLCAYSLGNFAAEMVNDYNMVGGFLTFDIVSENGKPIYIAEPIFIPTVYYYNMSFRNNRVYLMKDFTDELAVIHGIGFYGNKTTLKKLKSYVTDIINAEFLPDYLN